MNVIFNLREDFMCTLRDLKCMLFSVTEHDVGSTVQNVGSTVQDVGFTVHDVETKGNTVFTGIFLLKIF